MRISTFTEGLAIKWCDGNGNHQSGTVKAYEDGWFVVAPDGENDHEVVSITWVRSFPELEDDDEPEDDDAPGPEGHEIVAAILAHGGPMSTADICNATGFDTPRKRERASKNICNKCGDDRTGGMVIRVRRGVYTLAEHPKVVRQWLKSQA